MSRIESSSHSFEHYNIDLLNASDDALLEIKKVELLMLSFRLMIRP